MYKGVKPPLPIYRNQPSHLENIKIGGTFFTNIKVNRRQQLDGEKVDSLPSKPNNQAILTDLRQGASEDQKFDCQGLHSVKKREI